MKTAWELGYEAFSTASYHAHRTGLTVAGTRITLYDVLGYLHAGWSPEKIRAALPLSEQQSSAALAYIADHRDAVEAEYQTVLAQADASRRYWEEQNREQLARIADVRASTVYPPDKATLYAKLAAQRARREQQTATRQEHSASASV